MAYCRPQLFKRWINLYRWIVQSVFLILIRWIVIYPMDSAIQRLNNWGLYIFFTCLLRNSFIRLLILFLLCGIPHVHSGQTSEICKS